MARRDSDEAANWSAKLLVGRQAAQTHNPYFLKKSGLRVFV